MDRQMNEFFFFFFLERPAWRLDYKGEERLEVGTSVRTKPVEVIKTVFYLEDEKSLPF